MWHFRWGILLLLIFTLLLHPFDPFDLAVSLELFEKSAFAKINPNIPEEAQVLWKRGKTALQEGRLKTAIFCFQQVIARFPVQARPLQAHFLLGQAYFQLNQDGEAEKALQFFIDENPNQIDSYRARILLAKTLLRQKKWNEAYLTTQEIEKGYERKIFPQEIFLNSLLLRSQSLVPLGKTDQARLILDSVLTQSSAESPSPERIQIKGETLNLQLEMKLATCDRQLTAITSPDENLIRDQFNNKAICLMESLNFVRTLMNLKHPPSISRSSTTLDQALHRFQDECQNPKGAIRLAQVDKKFQESPEFWRELSDLLQGDSDKTLAQTRQILQGWNKRSKGTE